MRRRSSAAANKSTGWQPDEKGRWKAPAPCDDFRQLYVDGVRATRARGDPPAGMKLVGHDGYTTTAVDMAELEKPQRFGVLLLIDLGPLPCKVQSIKRRGR